MASFKVEPVLQKHAKSKLDENIEAVKASEIFFIFGDRSYIDGCKLINSDTIKLINLAKSLDKPFILCIDNNLPLQDQVYLRNLCPQNKTQVFSFNPKLYSDMQLHKKILTILDGAINNGVVNDPFANDVKEGVK
jgi:hypothetical protein